MKDQQLQVVRLATEVTCGEPSCEEKTERCYVESILRGRYNTIELLPFCTLHEKSLARAWQRRYFAQP